MRVIAGEFKSRRLKALPGLRTRPTPDRLREALFSVLAPRLAGCVFLDAYAGCGSVGIEALSRGAREAIFLEEHKAASRVIQENLQSLGATARAVVVTGKTTAHLDRFQPDIVFLDPPYGREREYRAALEILAKRPPSLIIAQHSSRFAIEERYGALKRVRVLRQGDNSLSFYEEVGDADDCI